LTALVGLSSGEYRQSHPMVERLLNEVFEVETSAGSLFVGRILTVVTTLRLQGRNVLNYLTEACRAKQQGKPAPSLLSNTLNADRSFASVA